MEIPENIFQYMQFPICPDCNNCKLNECCITKGKIQAKDEVDEALKKAHALSFVQGLEEKAQTFAGEKGNRLSTGQKQRIAIARALIRGSGILILDEATSNVDNISEMEILRAVDEIANDSIVFIIAHKLENVSNCDEIIVLENGRIVERGTHNELMRRNGYYKRLKDRGMEYEFTA